MVIRGIYSKTPKSITKNQKNALLAHAALAEIIEWIQFSIQDSQSINPERKAKMLGMILKKVTQRVRKIKTAFYPAYILTDGKEQEQADLMDLDHEFDEDYINVSCKGTISIDVNKQLKDSIENKKPIGLIIRDLI